MKSNYAIAPDQKSFTFELLFSLILGAPIAFYLTASFAGEALGLLFSIALIALVVTLTIQANGVKQLLSPVEREPLLFFGVLFAVALSLCLRWPDFLAMGERLRDFALLSATIDSPIQPREPWMVGESVNYYLYWYRFSAFWSSIFMLPIWRSYHLTAAFAFAFYGSCCYRILKQYCRFALPAAAIISLLVLFGSNVAGILSAFSGSSDWWWPSRVIKGTINEFPAWSFLLGDLHPHFLNLGSCLFLLCLAQQLWNLPQKIPARFGIAVAFLVLCALFQYNSNAWEVPITLATVGIFFGLSALGGLAERNWSLPTYFCLQHNTGCSRRQYSSLLALILLASISLFLSSRNILPGDYPWSLVQDPIAHSELKELALHWGIPFLLIVIALIGKRHEKSKIEWLLIGSFSISLAYQNPVIILSLLLAWILFDTVCLLRSGELQVQGNALVQTLGISSILFILVCEIVFLNDPYGGENERMNTVFKVYSAVWAPLHLFAIIALYRILKSSSAKASLALLSCATLPAFFLHTIPLRANTAPSWEGLATIENQFPGVIDTVRYLRQLPRQTVLEVQGPPYSYTTHVATLSSQNSYLGWANHVGLLTRNHGEVDRRDEMSDRIYRETDCDRKKQLLQQEGIAMLVVGPLERQKYGATLNTGFECLTKPYGNSGYQLYTP